MWTPTDLQAILSRQSRANMCVLTIFLFWLLNQCHICILKMFIRRATCLPVRCIFSVRVFPCLSKFSLTTLSRCILKLQFSKYLKRAQRWSSQHFWTKVRTLGYFPLELYVNPLFYCLVCVFLNSFLKHSTLFSALLL